GRTAATGTCGQWRARPRKRHLSWRRYNAGQVRRQDFRPPGKRTARPLTAKPFHAKPGVAMRRTGLPSAMILALGLAGYAAPAQAGFNVCNKSNLPARVALGHFDGTHWSSEGWWTIQPNACAGILS